MPTAAPQLYNEEILDLFDSTRDPDSRHRKSNIKIHEDASGSIYTTGVTSRLISSQDEVGAGWGRHRAEVATGQGCAMWGQLGGERFPPGWECSPGGVLEKVSVSTELHRVCPDSLRGCFKVFFPAWCHCS